MTPKNAPACLYRELIQSNCKVWLGSHAAIDVISQCDADGKWSAHAVHVQSSRARTCVLSGSGGGTVFAGAVTLEDALNDLHVKSAEAVGQYVRTNGFAPPPDLSARSCAIDSDGDASDTEEDRKHTKKSGKAKKKAVNRKKHRRGRKASDDRSDVSSSQDSDSDSSSSGASFSTVTGSTASSSFSDNSSDSSDDDVVFKTFDKHGNRIRLVDARKQRRRRRAKKSPPAYGLFGNGPHGSKRKDSTSENKPKVSVTFPDATTNWVRGPSNGFGAGRPHPNTALNRGCRPPPPPGWPHHAQPIILPAVGGPGPLPGAVTNRAPRSVMMHIRWLGRGELNVLEQCAPSARVIKNKAVQAARLRESDFKAVQPDDAGPPVLPHGVTTVPPTLRPEIKRFVVGGVACVNHSASDDLSAIFDSAADPAQCIQIDLEVRATPGLGPTHFRRRGSGSWSDNNVVD